jgi:hypothetical protein
MKKTKVTVRLINTAGVFGKVEGATVIMRSKAGVITQRDIYSRGGQMYASVGSGFVGLCSNGFTSSPGHAWTEIVPTGNEPFTYVKPSVGYLEVA